MLIVRGEFIEAKREPWKNNPEKYDCSAVVKVGERDHYGETIGEYAKVRMADAEFNQLLGLQRGQQVEIPIRAIAKVTKAGEPYVILWVPKGAKIRAAKARAVA